MGDTGPGVMPGHRALYVWPRPDSVPIAKRSHAIRGPSTGRCCAAIIRALLTALTSFTIDKYISIYSHLTHFGPICIILKKEILKIFLSSKVYILYLIK